MNNLQLFKFQTHDVEVIIFNNEPLFNPRHVGNCLGLSYSAVRNHVAEMNDNQTVLLKNSNVLDEDIRKLHNTGENFLTESGVYKLIFKSRMPMAEIFQDWVCDEVLPEIRKHGFYSIPTKKEGIGFIEQEYKASLGLCKLLGLDERQSKLHSIIAVKNFHGIDIKDRLELTGFVSSEDKAHYSVTEFAENFLVDCSARKLNKTLVILDIQKPTYRKNKINGYVVSREENEKYFTRLHTNKKHSDGTPVTQLRINKSLCELINNSKELFSLEGVYLK